MKKTGVGTQTLAGNNRFTGGLTWAGGARIARDRSAFRGGILTGWQVIYKLFSMRGFWLLALWVAVNDLLPMFLGTRDRVAHWAHLGGFMSGVLIAVVLLVTRLVDARRSDVLSVALGRHAWGLLGRPGGTPGEREAVVNA